MCIAASLVFVRHWSARPGLALSLVAILGLGVGGAVGLFAALNGLALRALPWPEADRLVVIHATLPHQQGRPAMADRWNRAPVTWSAWEALQESPAFESAGAWMSRRQILDLPRNFSQRSRAVEVMNASTSFLEILGARVTMGRSFTADEDTDYGSDAVLLSHETWIGVFGGREDIIGHTLALRPALQFAAEPKTIVGVLRPGLRFPRGRPDLILPIGSQAWNGRFSANGFLRVLARLARGVTAEGAEAAAEPVVRGAVSPGLRSARVVPLRHELVGRFVPSLWLLFAGAVIQLAISVTVSAGLLVADVESRRREIAIRMALGASRGRLAQQVLAEQLTLGVAAAGVGLALAYPIGQAVIAMTGVEAGDGASAWPDRQLVSMAVVSIVMALLTLGLVAIRALSRERPSAPERGGGLATARRASAETIALGVVLATTLALTTAAGLFADVVLRVTARPLGFKPDNVVVLDVTPARTRPVLGPPPAAAENRSGSLALPGVASPLAERRVDSLRSRAEMRSWVHTADLLSFLETVPGVDAVAGSLTVPFGADSRDYRIRLVDDPAATEHEVQVQAITPSYFDVMGIPVLSGRTLTTGDREMGRAIVSDTFRKRFLKGDGVGGVFIRNTRRYTVVGVVADVIQNDFDDHSRPCYYVLDSTVASINHLLIRTSGDIRRDLPQLRAAVQQYNPDLLVTSSQAMADLLAKALIEESLRLRTAVAFCVVTLAMAAAGIFSLLRRQVAERHRELGVRLALGARPRHLYVAILRPASRAVFVGLGGGVLASLLLVQIVRSTVEDIPGTTAAVLGISAGVVLLVALLATIGPVRRASLVDPTRAFHD